MLLYVIFSKKIARVISYDMLYLSWLLDKGSLMTFMIQLAIWHLLSFAYCLDFFLKQKLTFAAKEF